MRIANPFRRKPAPAPEKRDLSAYLPNLGMAGTSTRPPDRRPRCGRRT